MSQNNKNQANQQHNKSHSNQKKFVCIFDSSHYVESEQKLIAHMRKCKAMQKQSYLCCKYNGLHWIKHDAIDTHQAECPDKNKLTNPKDDFTRILPEQISQYSIPFQIDMSMVQSSNRQQYKLNEKESVQFQTKGMKKKQALQKRKKVQMWKQPCFQDYLKKKGYKENSNIRYANRHDDSFIGNNQSFFA